MTDPQSFPLLLSVEQVLPLLDDRDWLILDVGQAARYAQQHLPGALHLDYAQLVASDGQAQGLLPPVESLVALFTSLGIAGKNVLVYDDHQGAQAARLIWTLAYLGFDRCALLDGGFPYWQSLTLPVTDKPGQAVAAPFDWVLRPELSLSSADILAADRLTQLQVWDARSSAEYRGEKQLAARGGHIPGALNLDWLELLQADGRLKPVELLQQLLTAIGLERGKQQVCYCHTHRRSALAWLVLQFLGYPHAAAYAGSWSQWGNHPGLPVEH